MFGEEYTDEGKLVESPTYFSKGENKRKSNKKRPSISVITSAARAGENALQVESGEDGEAEIHLKTVEEIVKELDEDENVGGQGGCCARLFIPFVVAVMIVTLLAATVMTSGSGGDVSPSPRAAVVIMEGFEGSVFDHMVNYEGQPPLPNIATMLSSRKGSYTRCINSGDNTCARSVVVESQSAPVVSSGASLTSILSGVAPVFHQVLNDTTAGFAAYARTSATFPSLAKRVMDAGLRVITFGTSGLLNAIGPNSGSCSEAGVLDMECAASSSNTQIAEEEETSLVGGVTLDCFASSTCNSWIRNVRVPSSPTRLANGVAEARYSRQLQKVFGGLAYLNPSQEAAEQNPVADILDASLFIFHFDALAVRANSPSLPYFQYSNQCPYYTAQAYLLDAMVGEALAFIRDRARSQKENWLVLGTSDHGGSGKTFQSNTKEHTAIPFFVATYTQSTRGYSLLKPLSNPVSQLDVLPTVLRWLNVAPFDDTTEEAMEGRNTSALTEEVEAHVNARKETFDGQVQAICSSGVDASDCSY